MAASDKFLAIARMAAGGGSPLPVKEFPRLPELVKTSRPDVKAAWDAWERMMDDWRKSLFLSQGTLGGSVVTGAIQASSSTSSGGGSGGGTTGGGVTTQVDVLGTFLAGLDVNQSGAISSSDSVLSAFGRLQGAKVAKAGDTMSGVLRFYGAGHAGLKLNGLFAGEQALISAEPGMIHYNKTQKTVDYHDGTGWVQLSACGNIDGGFPGSNYGGTGSFSGGGP